MLQDQAQLGQTRLAGRTLLFRQPPAVLVDGGSSNI
jgi:hypothetical protein